MLSLDDLAEAKGDELAALIEAQLFKKRLDKNEPTVKEPAMLASDEEEPAEDEEADE